MNLPRIAIKNQKVIDFLVLLLILGGIGAFFSLGQLEDPEFTIKTAVVSCTYPGASPEEVELEVTNRLELAIQEMPQLDKIESTTRAGFTTIKAEMLSSIHKEQVPQVWDELRKKIRDATPDLPPGAGKPLVSDDFGDVYGFLLSVSGDGYSYAELEEYVKGLKKELSLVDGVSRVALWGVQPKVIYVDVAEKQLSELGIPLEVILNTLNKQNMVVDAGSVDIGTRRLRIQPAGAFSSAEDIANLSIAPSLGSETKGEIIRLGDIAKVRRGYLEPARQVMRFDGKPSIGMAISNAPRVNIVDLGCAIDRRLDELIRDLPVGIEVNRIAWQSDLVTDSLNGFFINLIEAVLIVLVVLTVSMGWRMGIIIGGALILTILATFIAMAVLGIDLQRMSLGALIVAMGMMVDNAIVVADGFVVRVQKGMQRVEAAIEAARQTMWPLLGATVVAVMAFYPIYSSPGNSGEYCASLFIVVGLSLLISWVLAVMVTPIQCIAFMKVDKHAEGAKEGKLLANFRCLLKNAIRHRVTTIGVLLLLMVASIVSFGSVKKMFFPESSRMQFMIDYIAPEGTRIESVSDSLKEIEQYLLTDDRVACVSAFIGQGPPRFYLPVESELPNQSYGQLVVNIKNEVGIKGLREYAEQVESWIESRPEDAMVRVRLYGLGPSATWKFEARFSGPAEADPAVLRKIANQALDILRREPLARKEVQTDWKQRVMKLEPNYNQTRGRWTGVSRENLGQTTKRAFDGLPVGQYREDDDLLPIFVRHTKSERENISDMLLLQVFPSLSAITVPLAEVADKIQIKWENPIICRYNRRRTITVQAEPIDGVTLPTLWQAVQAEFENIKLPPGYKLEWGGEYESTQESQADLKPGIAPAMVIMIFIIVALFNSYRPPLIIGMIIPFAIIGITFGLLATGMPFGFLALLGAMSLSGMMIKNAIVLLDEVHFQILDGKNRYDAIVEAAVLRLRPVLLAAGTTFLGVVPLLTDVLWNSLAATIMFGLLVGTMLTMVAVPVFYSILYRLPANGNMSNYVETKKPGER